MTEPPAQANALARIARNVGDLAAARAFYVEALGFQPAGPVREDPQLAQALRVEQIHIQRLAFAGQEIELSQCMPPGAAYDRADANLVHFQHIALLTPDIHTAYEKVLSLGAEPISEGGPVQLPAASGGVIAVKFRDPDGHPLEFIQKPRFGYDHSAISVANVERSVAFYARLGIVLDARQLNQGAEQDELDGLEDAQVDVVALRPLQASPHVELLCYRRPKAIPCQWMPADICADRLVFAADTGGLQLLRDPDGHVVLLDNR